MTIHSILVNFKFYEKQLHDLDLKTDSHALKHGVILFFDFYVLKEMHSLNQILREN
jgi:hypothetical protein